VQELDREVPLARRVDRLPAGHEARPLYEVGTGLQFRDEARQGRDVVLAVAVDGDDPVVALAQRVGEAHAQLGAELARVPLDEQCAHAQVPQHLRVGGAVGAAAVGDHDVQPEPEVPQGPELAEDALALVDDGDEDAEAADPLVQDVDLAPRHVVAVRLAGLRQVGVHA
jgi:hypothetical protein